MKNSICTKQQKQGFTLVELMVAAGLASLVLGGLFAGFSQHQKTFFKKNIEQELQQNVRTAMLFMQRDLRYAGSGMVMGFDELDDWFGMDSTVTNIPWITSSGTGRDEIIIAGITGEPVAKLSAWVNEGDSELPLTILPSNILPYDPVVGDVLLLQGIEAVMVTEIISDTQIRVSRDPNQVSTGVHLIYPPDSEIYQINVIKYWVADVEGVPTLLRDDSRFTYDSDADRVIADGIENFTITRNGDLVNINISGRSREVVVGYDNTENGDDFVRYELTSDNSLRNTSPALSIQGWPSDILYASADSTATPEPTAEPTAEPTTEPTGEPTTEPTAEPTEEPTAEPTEEPTAEPTEEPTAEPTEEPDDSPGKSGDAPGKDKVKRPKK